MIIHPFIELQAEYESWVAHVVPNADRLHEIDATARRLTRPEAIDNFAAITALFDIPAIIQATICEREDGCDFTKNPGQGDPLTHPSIHVPKGRPPLAVTASTVPVLVLPLAVAVVALVTRLASATTAARAVTESS